MKAIIVAGHICVDIVPRLPASAVIEPGKLIEIGPLSITLGGCVANTGGDLSHMGAPVKLCAAIGRDDLGDFVTRAFIEQELDDTGLQIINQKGTSYSLVFQPENADRTFWHYNGANALFDENLVDFSKVQILHVGYPPLLRGLLTNNAEPLRQIFARARNAGVTTSLDMAVVDPDSEIGALDWDAILTNVLPEVDVFSPSFDDAISLLHLTDGYSPQIAERVAQNFLDRGVALIALSCGADGICVRTADQERFLQAGDALQPVSSSWSSKTFWQPALKIDIIKTTNGAGDAATAGLLFGLLMGLPPEQTVLLATASAAVKISGQTTTLAAITQIAPELTHILAVQSSR